jgi:RNA polymerase sigma-70 factor (ECF subfamily)
VAYNGVMRDFTAADDGTLLAAMARGDQHALAALYDRYHRACFSFAVRILGSEGDAEDAVQETFVRLWRSAASYNEERAAVGSWVLSITRNLCLDELRRRRRRVPEGGTEEAMLQQPAAERTDEAAERTLIGEQVRAALRMLPGDQRSAIELVYFHGLSSQEVGRLLHVPAPTVRSRLRLGLLKLGTLLEGRVTVD